MTTATTAKRPAGRVARVLARREARIAFLFVLPAFLLFIAFRFGPQHRRRRPELLRLRHHRRDLVARARPLPAHDRRSAVLAGDGHHADLHGVRGADRPRTLHRDGARRAPRFRGARFFRSIFFLPVITSLVLAGSIFVWIFSANGSLVGADDPAGSRRGSWLAAPCSSSRPCVVVGVWSRFGYGMMILIAALQDVPRELEEAALVDGANAWQRFRYIIMPVRCARPSSSSR